MEFNPQLYEIFIANDLRRITTRLYRLSKAYSYLYSQPLSINDRDYLEKLLLTLHNQQSKSPSFIDFLHSSRVRLDSISANQVKILAEDLYHNRTSKQIIRRVYAFPFSDEQQIDGRFFPSLILTAGQFHRMNTLQNPLNYISNQFPSSIIEQRDIQQIVFSGKLTQYSAERILKDYWENPLKQGLANIQLKIIDIQEYLSNSSR